MEQLSPVNLDDYLNELLAELRRAEGDDDLNTPSPPPPTPEHDYHQQQQPQPGKEMSKMDAMLSAAEDWGELTRNDAEADIGASRPDLAGQVYDPVPGEGSCIDCEQPFSSSSSTCQPGFCTANLFKDVPSFPSPEPGSEQQLLDAQKHGLEVRDFYHRVRDGLDLTESFARTDSPFILSPPTKTGKNNGCRQTNARTVVINKYINFFRRARQKVALKRYRFKTRFYGTKIPVQTP